MKKYLLPMLAAGTIASPALAAPVITFDSTNTAIPAYTTAKVFESFESQTGGGASFSAAFNAANDTAGGITESGTSNAEVFSASVPGISADTDNNPNNKYLSILGGASYTVAFAAPVQFFSFIIGSIDNYNEVRLTLSDNSVIDLTGSQIINQAIAFNSTGNSSVAGRVNYDFGGGAGLKSAVFSSSRDSLEIDDLAAAVPEASTWAMMMVGVGAIGASVRRRRGKTSTRVSFA